MRTVTRPFAERLRRLLAEEHDALRAGAVDQLDALLRRKEALAEEAEAADVRALGCSPAEAEALRRLAVRNAALLEAARDGIRAAIDRVGERARLAGRLDTYDASGARRELGAPPATRGRRS
ncbi:MAG: hypothetical protein GVY28_14175 [Alphaproteobacteria bacterium]|nr:hypothetical protein [Alphaproteobacteria bacterium]